MIKRFNPDFSLSISHELAYMRETPEGGYVAHGDYATLFSELESVKAERDRFQQLNKQTLQMAETIKEQADQINALAVENAAQGAALSLISGCYGLSPHIQSMCAVETPATDAALAAIREQACKALIDAFVRQVDAAGLDDSDSVTIFECRDTMKYAAEQAINPREAK